MSKRQCILVCGMHRSGTSAVAGTLYHAGIGAGKKLMEAQFDNPKGFFENQSVHDFNKELLKSKGVTWDSVHLSSFVDASVEFRDADYLKANSIIQDEFSKQDLFFIKDPLISLLLPFWTKVLSDLDVSPKVLIVSRKSDDIIASLSRRNNMSEKKASLLTSIYLCCARVYSIGIDRTTTSYSQLISDSKQAIDKVFENLNIGHTIDHKRLDSIQQFLSVNNKSQNDSIESVASLPTAIEAQREISQVLDRIKSFKEVENKSIKIIYDLGKGFTDKHSKILEFQNDEITAEWELPEDLFAKQIKFLLLGGLKQVRVNEVSCYKDEQYLKSDITSSAYAVNHAVYQFNDDNPSITYSVSEAINRIKINLSIGAPKKIESNRKSGKRILAEGIAFAIRHPGRLIKHANRDNLRILKNAIKREDPRFILKNFKNLLLAQKDTATDTKNTSSEIISPSIPSSSTEIKKKTVLFVTRGLPDYDKSSGGKRSKEVLKILAANSNLFILNVGKPDSRYTAHYSSMGIKILELGNTTWKELSATVVIYSHYFAQSDFPEIQQHYSKAKHIIDSVDLHYLREERSLGKWEGVNEALVAKNKAEELKAYSEVDEVWLVSKEESKHLKTELPEIRTSLVSNIHDELTVRRKSDQAKGLLFFGNFDHHPNISAVHYLVEQVWIHIRKESTELELIIAGHNPPAEIKKYDGHNGVMVIGYVEEDKVEDLYANSIAILAPLTSGAGVKGKITQAIHYRTPVITNTVGNEGIGLIDGESGFIADQPEELAQAALKIYSKQVDTQKLTQSALTHIQGLTSKVANSRRILNSIYTKVTICIVTYNRLDLLKDCINSIIEHTSYPNYEILVYSNGCYDGTAAYLQEVSNNDNLNAVYSKNNNVFVAPNIELMERATEGDIVLLNNDTRVTRGWLFGLQSAVDADDTVAIVGSKILYPNGDLQEYGSELNAEAKGWNLGKGDNPNKKKYMGHRAVQYVSACSMYIKRDFIDNGGTLDLDFQPCYFEDADLCFRVWEANRKVIVASDSVVYHMEGATAGKDESQGFKKYQSINRQKFLDKHSTSISEVNAKVKEANKKFNV